jgi:protease I
MSKKIAIVATDYFEEAELTSPKEALEKEGYETEVIAPKSGEIQGLNHMDPGQKVKVDKTLDEADPNDYDGIVVPGGVVNADHLRVDKKAQDLLESIMGAGKPTAIICHGPWLLVSSHLTRGKKLTSYHTLQDDIQNAGGEWVDEEVVVDDNLITSRTPDDLPAFNKALLGALQG